MSNFVVTKTNEFADYLDTTISWLAEAPVGLKLNKPLGVYYLVISCVVFSSGDNM